MEEDLMSRRLHKFNAKRREDFMLWSLPFEVLLESKELLEVVTTGPLENTTLAVGELCVARADHVKRTERLITVRQDGQG